MGRYEEILAAAAISSPLQDNTTGNAVTNDSGNNGTFSGVVNTSDNSVSGPTSWLSSGLSFDGSTEFVTCDPVAIVATNGKAFSYAAWVKTSSSGVHMKSVAETRSGSVVAASSMGVNPGLDDMFVFFRDDNNVTVTANGGPGLNGGVWNHQAVVSDGTNFKGYVNGVQVLSGTMPPGPMVTINRTSIGKLDRGSSENHWNGDISGVVVTTEVLSIADIVILYTHPPETGDANSLDQSLDLSLVL